MPKKISVIIPTFNEEDFIGRLLASLQGLKDTEIIIADGGSADNTLAIAERYTNSIIVSEPGRSVQMNKAAKIASGDIFFFLHADSKITHNMIDNIRDAVTFSDAVGGAFSFKIDSDNIFLILISFFVNIRVKIFGVVYGDQGIFVKRDIFERIGGFKQIPVLEDHDLFSRLKNYGRVIVLKDKIVTSARRWEREGILYTTIKNLTIRFLYNIGISPHMIKKLCNY